VDDKNKKEEKKEEVKEDTLGLSVTKEENFPEW